MVSVFLAVSCLQEIKMSFYPLTSLVIVFIRWNTATATATAQTVMMYRPSCDHVIIYVVSGWQAIGSGVYTCLLQIAKRTHLRDSIKGLILSFDKQKCHFCVCITRTAMRSCRDPETHMSFLVARWRPMHAAACRVCRRCPGRRPRLHQSPAAAVCRQGGSL